MFFFSEQSDQSQVIISDVINLKTLTDVGIYTNINVIMTMDFEEDLKKSIG